MKLSVWASKNGISYRTVLRWYHDGNLPARAEQLETGTIPVHEDTTGYSKVKKHVTWWWYSMDSDQALFENQD